MTRQPGVDYPVRTTCQPDEPPLELAPDHHLRRIRAAVESMRGNENVTRAVFDDFIICPRG